MTLRRIIWTAALGLCFATPALADPCKAIPDHGRMPSYLARGSTVAGPVVYVGDGDSLCVGLGPRPDQWVEVRISDFYAPELHEPGGAAAKAALERLVKGRRLICVTEKQSYDRVVARCDLAGRNLGDLLRATGEAEGGRGWAHYSATANGGPR